MMLIINQSPNSPQFILLLFFEFGVELLGLIVHVLQQELQQDLQLLLGALHAELRVVALYHALDYGALERIHQSSSLCSESCVTILLNSSPNFSKSTTNLG